MDKRIIGVIILLLILTFNIFGIYNSISNKVNCKIESKDVWITSEVEKINSRDEYSTSVRYYVKYDDNNGETGILYTNKNGYNLAIGDVVTVYRNVEGDSQSDSTHGWHFSEEVAQKNDTLTIIIFIILTVINIILICNILIKIKRKEKLNG